MPLTPGPHFLENYYRTIFIGTSGTTREPVYTMLLNSFVMAMVIALRQDLISILSAYAIVYFKFPLRMSAFWIIFITLMLPVEVRIYPTYKIAADLNLLDTYAGLTLPLVASATATLLFRQFFMTVPDELVEASRIDGAGPFRFFFDTLLPLSRTNMAALFVILFIYGWNQYLWPLLITTRDDMQTIVIGIKKMIVTSDALTEWQLVMATAMLAMLPPVRGDLMQKLFVRAGRDGEVTRIAGAAGRRPSGESRRLRDWYRWWHEVTLKDVKKVYAGGVEAVKGVTFDVPDGHFCVLVGPSGCGKSTLLRMIAGVETITSGEIRIGERVVNDIEPSERDIAMVFQNYALYPHMRVYDNMAYGLRNRKMPKAEIDKRVREAARILEIERAARPQAAPAFRRAAPARRHGARDRAQPEGVPVRRAAVEPRCQAARLDAGRDQEAAEDARHDLGLRHARPARGDDARRHAGGDECRPGRADRRAARRLRKARDDVRRDLHRRAVDEPADDDRRRARASARQRRIPAEGAIIGMRPEDLALAAPGVADRRRHHAALTVGAVERVGPESFVYGTLDRGDSIIVRLPGTHAPAPGERAVAVATRAKLHVFSADGQRRL